MKKLLILLGIVAAVATTACKQAVSQTEYDNTNTTNIGDTLTGDISFSGAFALYPMVVKWADEFRRLHPNVRIDISGGGAGKGMTDALAKMVDLGMVSREIYDVEKEKGAMEIAVVIDAVVPTINSENPFYDEICQKGITKHTAAALWNNEYKTYGQFLGTNSKIPIRIYTRSDACGAAETWGAWFDRRQEDLQGTAVYSDPGVARAIQKDKVGIGYNNIAYVYDLRSRKPHIGLAVLPLDVNENGQIDPEEQFYETSTDLITAISAGKFPFPPARDLYLVSNGLPDRYVVKEFLRYILTDGQKYAVETGFIPLSPETVEKELAKLEGK